MMGPMSAAQQTPETGLPPTIEAWAQGYRHGDRALTVQQMADDVVLTSPLTEAFVFRGRHQVGEVCAAALDLIEEPEVAGVTGSGREWAVRTTARLGGRPLEEVQWLTLGDDGRVAEVRLLVRPVPAAVSLLARLGDGLHQRGVMPRRAAFASRGALPMALAMDAVERWIMPRVAPPRPPRGQLRG